MYKFKIVTKDKYSNKHLNTDISAKNHTFKQSKIDINDLSNSSLPNIVKGLSSQEWKTLKKEGKLKKTVVVKTTLEIRNVT